MVKDCVEVKRRRSCPVYSQVLDLRGKRIVNVFAVKERTKERAKQTPRPSAITEGDDFLDLI